MNYTYVIVGTTIGFIVLAAILLVPIYNFLKKEERASEKWTQEEIDRIRERERSSTDDS